MALLVELHGPVADGDRDFHRASPRPAWRRLLPPATVRRRMKALLAQGRVDHAGNRGWRHARQRRVAMREAPLPVSDDTRAEGSARGRRNRRPAMRHRRVILAPPTPSRRASWRCRCGEIRSSPRRHALSRASSLELSLPPMAVPFQLADGDALEARRRFERGIGYRQTRFDDQCADASGDGAARPDRAPRGRRPARAKCQQTRFQEQGVPAPLPSRPGGAGLGQAAAPVRVRRFPERARLLAMWRTRRRRRQARLRPCVRPSQPGSASPCRRRYWHRASSHWFRASALCPSGPARELLPTEFRLLLPPSLRPWREQMRCVHQRRKRASCLEAAAWSGAGRETRPL